MARVRKVVDQCLEKHVALVAPIAAQAVGVQPLVDAVLFAVLVQRKHGALAKRLELKAVAEKDAVLGRVAQHGGKLVVEREQLGVRGVADGHDVVRLERHEVGDAVLRTHEPLGQEHADARHGLAADPHGVLHREREDVGQLRLHDAANERRVAFLVALHLVALGLGLVHLFARVAAVEPLFFGLEQILNLK